MRILKNIARGIFLLVFLFFIYEYIDRKTHIGEIRKKYSSEELNYFYEIAFYNEARQKQRSVRRWDKETYIYLDRARRSDSMALEYLVDELRQMRLPIDFYFTGDSLQANMKIYFGEREYLNEVLFDRFHSSSIMGAFSLRKNGILIGIRESTDTLEQISTIQEEFIQSLGLISDSWTNPGSLFFEGVNHTKSFSEKDRRLLLLLYEKAFSNRYVHKYTYRNYERDFGSVLYKVHSARKIAKHMQENNTPARYLDSITKFVAGDDYYKFPQKVWVLQHGAYTDSDNTFYQKIIHRSNEVLEGKLTLIPLSDSTRWIQPYIALGYSGIHDYPYCQATAQYYRDASFLYAYTYGANINIKWPLESRQYEKDALLLMALCKALGLDFNKFDKAGEILEPDEDGDPTLKSEYWKILSLYYEPVFYGGIKMDEIEQAKKLLRKGMQAFI